LRYLAFFLWCVMAVGLVCWVLFYSWIVSLACAYSSPNGQCGTTWPWQLGGEDLLFLIVIPATLLSGLAGAAMLAGGHDNIIARVMVLLAGLLVLMSAVFSVI
jgi:hypothetical protein